MSNKLHVVVNQVGGYAREDAPRPYAVGAYTTAQLAEQVKMLAMDGAQVTEVELNVVPPGYVKSAQAMGIKLEVPPSWQDVQRQLAQRYQSLIRRDFHALEESVGSDLAKRALKMCDYLLSEVDEMPEDKANRWMGFIQGVLTVGGLLTIEAEREFTRPLFHAAKGPSPSRSV